MKENKGQTRLKPFPAAHGFLKGFIRSGGIYRKKGNRRLSYPDYGNDFFFQLEDKSYWFSHRNAVIADALRKYGTDSGVFLDIGGGNGCVAKYLQDAGYDVLLVEPGVAGARNAAKRGVKRVVCAGFEDLGLDRNSIGFAGMFDVVEHIKNDRKMIAAVSRTLKPHGCLLLTVPAMDFLWSKDDAEAGHYRRYHLAGLKDVVEAAGLKVIYSTYFFSYLFMPVLFLRALPWVFTGGVGAKKIAAKASDYEIRGFTAFMIKTFASAEKAAISAGIRIPFGTSCLAVCIKP
ncbi:MAG: class I SAM-dependent methyltransferase [Spirochaetia bacterium]|nr:class I SAM-dependent methyltransferase [Spirochaetia bacterium]